MRNNYDEIDERLAMCPLCDKPVISYRIGNSATKKRSIAVECKPCNLTMKMSAIRRSFEWLEEKIIEKWNKRVGAE